MGVHAGFSPIVGSAALTSPGGPRFRAEYEGEGSYEAILRQTHNLSMHAQATGSYDAEMVGVGRMAANYTGEGTYEAELVSIGPPPSDYVAYFPFNDLSTIDETGNHSITFAGTPSVVPGPVGNAVKFGVGSSPTDSSVDFVSGSPSKTVTYAYWHKHDSVDVLGYALTTRNGLTLSPSGVSAMLTAYLGLDAWVKYALGVPASTTVFNHYVVQMSGTVAADSVLKIWVNGVLYEGSIATGTGTASAAAKPIIFGNYDIGGHYTSPEFANFYVYDRVLTQEEITTLAGQ